MYEIVRGIQKRKLSGDLVTPVIVRESASNLMVNYLLEHASEFPGVSTGRAYIRHYPYPDLAAQVLGYVGSITQTQLNHLGRGYNLNDEIGQTGVGGGVRQVSPRRRGGVEAARRQSQPSARQRAADGRAEAR